MCGVLLGDGLGIAFHEGGHLVANWLLGSEPYLRGIQGGGIPFFAVTHSDSLPARHEFIVSSAHMGSVRRSRMDTDQQSTPPEGAGTDKERYPGVSCGHVNAVRDSQLWEDGASRARHLRYGPRMG